MINAPKPEGLNDYYRTYLKFLKEDDLLEALEEQGATAHKLLSQIPAEMEDFRYADGKWMLKEVVGHLCDTERILSYRALRFSKNDLTELPGFDENSYMENSNFHNRTLDDIMIEWKHIRQSTRDLFESMTDEMLDRKGVANKVTVTPRILLYFIIVHGRHHISLIADRYIKMYKKQSV
jgi:uncharacterized damage-inducible protein DinB